MRKKVRSETTKVLEELCALERKPPKRTNRLIVRHLQCEESLRLSHALVQATENSSRGVTLLLQAPSEFLSPLV